MQLPMACQRLSNDHFAGSVKASRRPHLTTEDVAQAVQGKFDGAVAELDSEAEAFEHHVE